VSDENHLEDQTILAALAGLEKGVDTAGLVRVPGLDETSDTLARLYLETLGLSPFALEPITPSAGLEERILSEIQGEETQGVVEQVVVAPVAPLPPKGEEPQTGPIRPRLVPMPAAGGRGGAARRSWPLALAATLALALAGLSVWLGLQVRQRQSTIAELRSEVASLRERAETATAEAARAQNDVLTLTEKFALVTSPAVEVSPMRPDAAVATQPNAHGILFVASDRQHWYLKMRNLEPTEGQKAYCLWFINDSGPILGGAFSSKPGSPIELSASEMPAGTKDVRVTLEENGQVVQPAGQLVLKVAASYRL
jgi:hypothetical protein